MGTFTEDQRKRLVVCNVGYHFGIFLTHTYVKSHNDKSGYIGLAF
ncbi:17969_t:CDS:2 [Funneliformis caledonium]|uniref:17969_t:CDS:1 n=1 Tax=Funneliformis caledonium TaxID=1117310 RepID=A0A9N8YM84_9GLOM|nr:17969_t:CDS:2 [Funneliformis caledonium]